MTGTKSRAWGVPREWRRAVLPRLSGTAQFSSALMARYRLAAARPQQPPLLLAQRSATLVLHRYAGRSEHHFGVTVPTLVVRIEAAASQPQDGRVAPPTPPTPSRAGASGEMPMAHAAARPAPQGGNPMPPPHASPVRNLPPQGDPAMATLPQVLPLATRAVAVGVPGAASVPPAPPGHLASDMPTARPRVAPTAETAGDSQAPVTPTAAGGTRGRPAAGAEALPQQEIERVAERVLGSIERRILAERERHGRF